MEKYYELIKNNVIDFNELLLEQYYLLGLTEVDVVLLIKLHNLIDKDVNTIFISKLFNKMSISEEELSNCLVRLIDMDFINISLDQNKKEQYSLNGIYKKLSFLLSTNENDKKDYLVQERVKTTIKKLESSLNKILSPLELQMINRWFYEYNYKYDDIDKTINKALINKNCGVKYIDRSLHNLLNNNEHNEDLNDLKKLFNTVYGKNR
ncbi:MAG: DnaD domain protein [Bacilli bacterium]|jgi:DNA replication protein|nr:DnaD domain protein [Bacilli bacterium]MDD3121226.1 DnaD domain protein [Bacilli bacterium]MDD4062867.1 DnaD domain protein [Bacilli bacterium]MDD4481918.1 DnaD domain protein [Bacilli bacterium]MDY0363409.1 DnaD domain protein [Bacilli bacterium]